MCSNFNTILFADDAYLCSDKNIQIAEKRANTELVKVNEWLKTNKLSLNVQKSTYLLFTRSRTEYKINLEVGSNILEASEVVKYLGVLLDGNVTWTVDTAYR